MSSTQNIYIKPLQLEEARTVYIGHAHRDFPSNELKPFSMIEKLWNNDCYCGYGFYEVTSNGEMEHKLRAYAFTMADTTANMLLLDYFAVCEESRGKGYGGAALALLKEDCMEWDGIIFEVEDDETANSEEERKQRRRRIAFYEKNGVIMTKEKSRAFGVDYKLMVMPLGDEKAEIQLGEKLAAVYRKMLPDAVFKEQFQLR